MLTYALLGAPRTKKNSQRIFKVQVLLDRQRPRVEIEIEGLESGKASGSCI